MPAKVSGRTGIIPSSAMTCDDNRHDSGQDSMSATATAPGMAAGTSSQSTSSPNAGAGGSKPKPFSGRKNAAAGELVTESAVFELNARGALIACRRIFASAALFSFFINLLMLTVPIFMMQVFDRVMSSRSEDTLVMLATIAIASLATLGLLDWMRSKLLVSISSWIDDALGRHVLATSVRAASLHPEVTSVQGLRDLTQVKNFAAGSTIFAFFDAPWVPLYIAVIFMVHTVLGLVAVFGAAVLIGLALLNDFVTRKPLNEANRRAMAQLGFAEASARNAEAVEAMGMLDNLVQRWDQENRSIMAAQEEISRKAGTIAAFTKFFRLFIQLAIMAAAVFLALEHIVTPGAMIAGSIILGRALAPIEQMIGSWRSFVAARESYDRLNRMMERDLSDVRGEMTFPTPRGRLTAEAVSFAVRGATKPILRGVSFALEPGEALGLIGPSAAGKSTLARLLVGIWAPSSGKVRLDNIDVFQWNRQDFGKHVGYLPQDIELFAGTVRENIARMGEATDAQVIEAAVKSNAHDMILRLPDGYDTKIGTGGLGLSGGQRQRLGLARALFGNPRLLVLDEPNSNLDNEGEAALMESLKAARDAGVTIVLITHRPSVLAFVDKVLVLRDGMVEMFGGRNEVMSKLTRAVPKAGSAGQKPQQQQIAGQKTGQQESAG